jgi:hypothetical protein
MAHSNSSTNASAVSSNTPEPEPGLSNRLWGINWSAHFPIETETGVTIHISTLERVLPFIQEHYATIFQDDPTSPFRSDSVDALKIRYYNLCADFFDFRDGDRTVGVLSGAATDWSTYYLRTAAVHPDYANQRLIQGLLPPLFEILQAAGVERVEADTSPANFAVLNILSRLAFNVTGTVLSERWGASVRLTRHLVKENELFFLRQFCTGVKYQLKGSQT